MVERSVRIKYSLTHFLQVSISGPGFVIITRQFCAVSYENYRGLGRLRGEGA